MNANFDESINNLSIGLKSVLIKIPSKIKSITQEIRIRVNKPVVVNFEGTQWFVTNNGEIIKKTQKNLLISNQKDIFESFQNICDYSVYSFQEQIKGGYITIKGGHRIGICGTAIMNNGIIASIKNISSLNIRISRQINCVSKDLLNKIENGNTGALFVGPPSCGKTTMLRSVAKNLSDGSFGLIKRVVVVDERNEISSTYGGICQNELGLCDVLSGYPKGEGIMHAIRALSPDIVICDEIGNLQDIAAIEEGLNAGVVIIASAHAGSIQEFFRRKQISRLLKTGAFSKIVMMKNIRFPGCIEKIYEVGDKSAKDNRNVYFNFNRYDDRACRIAKA